MTPEQITRYLGLSARRLKIILNSGIDWKPEYEAELEKIDEELQELRPLVDAAHEQRRMKS